MAEEEEMINLTIKENNDYQNQNNKLEKINIVPSTSSQGYFAFIIQISIYFSRNILFIFTLKDLTSQVSAHNNNNIHNEKTNPTSTDS